MRTLTFLVCIVLCGASAHAMGQSIQRPVGLPTTFDVGIDRDGHKTYVVHGYMTVDLRGSGGRKSYDVHLPRPTDLDIDHIQADVLISSQSGFNGAGFAQISKIISNGSGDVVVSIDLEGNGRIRQLHYALYVATREVSPWPKAATQSQDAAKLDHSLPDVNMADNAVSEAGCMNRKLITEIPSCVELAKLTCRQHYGANVTGYPAHGSLNFIAKCIGP